MTPKKKKEENIIKKNSNTAKLVGIGVASAVIVGGGIFFWQNSNINKLEANYTEIINQKDTELKQFTVDVVMGYVAASRLEPGQDLTENDIVSMNLPTSMSPNNVIADPSFLIGKRIKIGADVNTPITKDMVYSPEELTDDVRKREYDYVKLPLLIQKTDILDVEVAFPDGTNYVVVAQKKLTALDKVNNYIFMNLRLLESTLMDAAFFEAVVWGGEVRAVQYVDGVTQKASFVNYYPNKNVIQFIQDNPNIIASAKSRYSGSAKVVRTELEKAWEEYWEAELPAERIAAGLPEGSYVSSRFGGGGAVIIVNPDGNATADPSVTDPSQEQGSVEEPITDITQNPTGTIEFNDDLPPSQSPPEEPIVEAPSVETPTNEESSDFTLGGE